MKRSSLLYVTLVAALLAGLAHLRSDWLAGAPERPEPAHTSSVERAVPSAEWSPRQSEPRAKWLFFRQR